MVMALSGLGVMMVAVKEIDPQMTQIYADEFDSICRMIPLISIRFRLFLDLSSWTMQITRNLLG
jgi:hypothetical protein